MEVEHGQREMKKRYQFRAPLLFFDQWGAVHEHH